MDCPWRTPGQPRYLFRNLQISREQLEGQGLEPEAGGGVFAVDSRALCLPGATLPTLAARLSPGRLSQRGPGLAVHHSVTLRGLRKGPWEMDLPGPASVGVRGGEGRERAPLLPKHRNLLSTNKKDFKGPSELGEDSGGRRCPFENLDSDGCQFNKSFPDSGLGALGPRPCGGYPSKGPQVGVAQQPGQASTRPHWEPLSFCPGTIQGQGQRRAAGVGSSPHSPSSSTLCHCSLH